jgi:hypothetical protein
MAVVDLSVGYCLRSCNARRQSFVVVRRTSSSRLVVFSCLASKDDSTGQSRTMAEFCQQIPVSIEHLLRVSNNAGEDQRTNPVDC